MRACAGDRCRRTHPPSPLEGERVMATAVSCVILVIGFLGFDVAESARDLPIEGLYHADGVSPNGGDYEGLVRIIQFGESYLVSWTFAPDPLSEEEPDSIGVGIVAGQTLSVSYFGDDFAGVVVYRIESGGRRLVGQWTGAGGDGVLRPETLTRLDAASAAARAR
jgi:hypothetical protein